MKVLRKEALDGLHVLSTRSTYTRVGGGSTSSINKYPWNGIQEKQLCKQYLGKINIYFKLEASK